MKTFLRNVLSLAAILAALNAARLAAEPILYAIDGASYLYTQAWGTVHTLLTTDASDTLVGSYQRWDSIFSQGTSLQGLTYDAASDILYASTTFSRGISFLSSGLYAIDRVTGRGTGIRGFNVPLYALAFDASTNTLSGAPGNDIVPPPGGGFTHTLYRLDPTTGAATPVMGSNFTYVSLAFDPVSHVLYGASSNPQKLVRIDLSTRQETPIADVFFGGISFHPETGTLYATTYGTSPSLPKGLYTVDLATGTPLPRRATHDDLALGPRVRHPRAGEHPAAQPWCIAGVGLQSAPVAKQRLSRSPQGCSAASSFRLARQSLQRPSNFSAVIATPAFVRPTSRPERTGNVNMAARPFRYLTVSSSPRPSILQDHLLRHQPIHRF